jgi:glycosyltransferase involved in cell wall biosynthesis
MFRLRSKLEEVYTRERFDLLHSEHVFPVMAAEKFSKRRKIPHVATIEGISKETLHSKFVYAIYRLVFPRVNPDVLVVWSRFIEKEFLRKWGIKGDNIRVIPGGIDTDKFNPSVNGGRVRETLGKKKIIFTAKPMYKTNALGLAYVIKAMKYVLKERSDCTLVIGGNGRKRGELEALVRRLGIQKNVAFTGWINQEKIPAYYAASDVVVDSIIYHHAGSVTVLESLASGKPNVLCNIECLPGENSFPSEDISVLVKPRDSEDMAKGIIRLLEDEKYGKKLGRNAWNFISRNFSINRVASEYKRLYEEITA